MYAVIVREYFPPKEAGTRIGIALMFALFGMALGGWMSGVDLRPHWLLPRGLRQRLPVEPAQLAIIGWLLIRSRTWISGRLAAA